MKMLRRLMIVAAVGLVGVMITAAVNSQQPPSEDLIEDSAEVLLGNMALDVNVTGVIEPVREVPMRFGAMYEVKEVLVREGDSVRAGDVIATLDLTDYGLALRSAENQLASAENQFNGLVTVPRDVDMDAALAALDAAEAQAWAAWESRPSDEQIEIARLQIEDTKNQLWQAQLQRDILVDTPPEFRSTKGQNPYAQEIQVNDGLSQLETSVTVAEERYNEVRDQGPNGSLYGSAREMQASAEITLDNLLNPDARDVELTALNMHLAALNVENIAVQITDLQLVAPFDGVIIENNLSVGELPPAGPAIVIADTSVFTVDVEVDETDVVNIAVGMPVELYVDALPEAEIVGRITSVDLLPLPEFSVPTYRATVMLDPTEAEIRAGMSSTATVQVEELQDVIVIPSRFVEFTDEGAFVTVMTAGTPQRLAVTTGYQSDGMTQIVDGLQPGQRVVLIDETASGGLRSLLPQ